MRNLAFSVGLALAVAGAVAGAVQPAQAQDRDQLVEAFAGEWFLFDPAFGDDGGTCALTLGRDAATMAADRMEASARGCGRAVGAVSAWTVEDGVLRLYDSTGGVRAELGGNQRRITGTLLPSELGVVIERAAGDGWSQDIALAVQQHRCFFVGTTADCATEDQLAAPAFPDTGPQVAEVTTLGNLLVRSQPRRDAGEVGTIATGTCVRVNQCLVASDGLWCRARFGEITAWLAKVALRQEEWPIITFENGCEDSPS